MLMESYFGILPRSISGHTFSRMLLRTNLLAGLMLLFVGCGVSSVIAPAQVDLAELLPDTLVAATGHKTSREVLANKLIGLYFSASWCPPCRSFTPKLIQFRNAHASQFEVLLVGWDQSAQEQMAYLTTHGMPWPALPNQGEHAKKLGSLFGVQSIPTLIVLSPEGKVISTQGRKEVASRGHEAFGDWLTKYKEP